jgi:hypothetical protein
MRKGKCFSITENSSLFLCEFNSQGGEGIKDEVLGGSRYKPI